MGIITLEVGELVAFLRLEDQDFQTKLRRNGVDMQRLGSSAKSMLQPVATAFAAGTTAAGGLLTAVVAQGAAYNKLQQTSRAALTTILGGAEAANEQMDKLDDFAQNSPFARSTFITAQQQMLAFGIETEKVIPYLGAIQDGVAAMGGSNQEISELAFIMAQISAAGKITGQDLMQFGQRGVNAAKLIGDEMGKTETEIRESITAGTLDAGEALDALAAGMQTTYDGAAANVKNTMDGAVDRVRAASRDIGALLAAPFIDPQGGGRALDWANGLADLLRAVQGQLEPLVTRLLPQILPIADGITARLEDAARAVEGLNMDLILAQIGELSEYATPIAAVAAGLFAMGTQARPIAALGLSINPVAAALLAIVASSEDARAAASNLLSALTPLTDEFGHLLQAGGDLVNTVLSGLTGLLLEVADGAGETGGMVDILALGLDGLTGAIQFVNDVVGPLIGWLTDAASAASGFEGPILGVVAALVLMRSVDVGGILSGITGALSSAKPQWEASQAVLQSLGHEAGVMNTAMLTARTGVSRLGGALKGLMIANAPMLAITALAGVIGHYMQQAAEAKALTDDLASSFDELTGAATAETDRMILEQLNDSLTAGQWDILEQLGYDYMDVIDAIKAGGPELEALEAQLDRTTSAGKKRSIQTGETIDVTEAEAEASRRLKAELELLGPAYVGATSEAEMAADYSKRVSDGLIEAKDSANATTDALQEFEDALAVLSDEASTAEQRLGALNSIMDMMANGAPTVTEATIDHADALRDATSAAERFEFSQEQLNSILTDDGSLNLQSEAVSNLRGEMDGLVDTAQRQADAFIQQGDVEAAVKVYEDLDGQFRALAETAGVEAPEAVDALIESLHLLPPEVIVDLQANGTEAAEENIAMVQQRLTEMPDRVMTYIDGDTEALDTSVEYADLRLAYVASMTADPNIGADDEENLRIVGAAIQRLDELERMETTPEIEAEKSALERVVEGAKIDLNSIPDKEAEVIAEVFGFDSVESLRRAIDQVKSKSVQVTTNFVTTGSRPRITTPGRPTATIDADGSVHLPKGKRFADGGVEHRVAQIAPAGAWRVWAEEETGGEAYIPLAAHKRGRSLAIMHDVAARFGHVMVPVTAQRYANGAVNAPPPAPQPAPVSLDTAAIAAAVQAGMQSATVIAQVSDRVAANLYQRGASASRAMGAR